LSQQRILWVVFGVQFSVAIWLLGGAGKGGRGRALTAVAIGGTLMLAGGALYVSHKAKFSQSRADLQVIENDYRLMHWKRVFARIQDHPLAGAGFGREAMKKAYPDLVPVGEPQSLLWHPHNVFLNYGIAMGWPGMLALAALFIALLHAYWRHWRAGEADRRVVAVAGILLIIGVVGRNLTNDFFVRDGALLFWALNGAMLGYLARGARAASPAGRA
ncbi:MAG: O-antigen ligase family protein, partial [Betaproteobacteria bacterium]|nr:O-antigen ligase family protein [Betaproteobacteria bacterium]